MKISIVTDGNNKLGLGHVYQSLTLADALTKRSGGELDIAFMTSSDDKVRGLIQSAGYAVEYFCSDDAIFNKLKLSRPDRIIFDNLDVSPCLAERIQGELPGKLVIFTNLTEANKFADITVFPRIGSNYKNIVSRIDGPPRTEYVGPKFWMLRPEFHALKGSEKIRKNAVENVMLIFGGSDPSNFSSSVLNELLQMDAEFNILLVLGASFEHNDELNNVLAMNKSSRSTTTIARNMKNVGAAMRESDVVIASPGLSFFEALVTGTPVVVFHQNRGHIEEFSHIVPTMDVADLDKLPSIIRNKRFIFPTDPIIASMEIGEGRNEILDEILTEHTF